MSGAKALTQRQEALSHNLANAETNGFRADLMAYRAVPARQDGTATTRVWALESTAGFDAQSGPLRQTGNALDVAVRGDGWIAVQAPDGEEAYTRDGAFEVGADGTLQTRRGQPHDRCEHAVGEAAGPSRLLTGVAARQPGLVIADDLHRDLRT